MNSSRQLFLGAFPDEATICARCGYCNAVCCTHRELDWESTSPRGWLSMLRVISDDHKELASVASFPQEFVERLFNCTLCGKCGEVCPVHIDLRGLWIGLREEAVERGQGPAFTQRLREVEATEHNVFGLPNEERAEWVEFMPDAPDHRYQQPEASVLYFVGCVSSFSAGAQGIPKAFAKLLELAGVDFAILGGEEWCCGFPLLAAGLGKEAQALIEHNVQSLRAIGATTVVFNCPSCYHMWKHYYGLEGVKLLHSTQLVAQMLKEGRLRLGALPARVAYHDPCDLGRNSGVYEEPREVLRAIPGLDFVELIHNRAEAPCCGGGGDFEMLEPEMTLKIAARLLGDAERAQAERLVVACPQCQRTEVSGAEALGSQVQVQDIVELVLEALRAKPPSGEEDVIGES